MPGPLTQNNGICETGVLYPGGLRTLRRGGVCQSQDEGRAFPGDGTGGGAAGEGGRAGGPSSQSKPLALRLRRLHPGADLRRPPQRAGPARRPRRFSRPGATLPPPPPRSRQLSSQRSRPRFLQASTQMPAYGGTFPSHCSVKSTPAPASLAPGPFLSLTCLSGSQAPACMRAKSLQSHPTL